MVCPFFVADHRFCLLYPLYSVVPDTQRFRHAAKFQDVRFTHDSISECFAPYVKVWQPGWITA